MEPTEAKEQIIELKRRFNLKEVTNPGGRAFILPNGGEIQVPDMDMFEDLELLKNDLRRRGLLSE